jgi:pimeloyl-ACP methyl ester carboxylesterase
MNTLLYKNISVIYSDTGKGKTIVLLHGFLENSKMWKSLAPALAEQYRVVTIDLLGHGETECLSYVHSIEENAAVVNAVLNSLKIRRAVIAGHSMGGYVALAFAEAFPANTRALILINSTSKADSEERKINRDRAIVAVKQNYTAFVRMSIANLFSEDNRERLSEEIDQVREDALKTPLQGIVATLEGMKIRKDREYILAENRFPVLLILGRKDPVLNYDDNAKQELHEAVELVEFPDGHMSPIENKEELEQHVLKFMKSIR